MTVFALLSAINIALALYLLFTTSRRLGETHSIALGQIIATPALLACAYLILHTVGLLAHDQFSTDDATEAAWRVVDIVTMLAMIRLVKVAKD